MLNVVILFNFFDISLNKTVVKSIYGSVTINYHNLNN